MSFLYPGLNNIVFIYLFLLSFPDIAVVSQSITLRDYYHLKKQIEYEFVDGTDGRLSRSFLDLPKMEQQTNLKECLKKYCQKVCFCPK